jgi:hypothetical protein
MLESPLNSGKIKRRIVSVPHAFESKFSSCSCRAAIYASLAQLVKIPYLQLQAKGFLTGKFTLYAQTPVVDAGKVSKASRMIYPSTPYGVPKLADATTAFSDVMTTFTNSFKFETKEVTPDLPSDWLGADIIIPAGVPITLKVSLGLVAELSASRDNQFTASVGAFARADSSVDLFVFSRIENRCTDTSWLPTAKYETICQDVLNEALEAQGTPQGTYRKITTYVQEDVDSVCRGPLVPVTDGFPYYTNPQTFELGVCQSVKNRDPSKPDTGWKMISCDPPSSNYSGGFRFKLYLNDDSKRTSSCLREYPNNTAFVDWDDDSGRNPTSYCDSCDGTTCERVHASCKAFQPSENIDFFSFTKTTGPIVTSGFSAPTLTAKNDQKVVFGVGFYPMYTSLSFLFCAGRLTIFS